MRAKESPELWKELLVLSDTPNRNPGRLKFLQSLFLPKEICGTSVYFEFDKKRLDYLLMKKGYSKHGVSLSLNKNKSFVSNILHHKKAHIKFITTINQLLGEEVLKVR
ncbi:hypothetical protein JDW15_04370 [Aerococcaceae bacterium zg-ZJ1578]|uniref:hypothetical protein n=1 Tax=Aerococcaceae bacterium zg-252 TaxID=2796928 RepID=UPI001A23AB90|nr:hypothetical protein [Aerococcaceae bacterium zg-1578]